VRNSGPCPTSAVAAHKDGRNGIGLANPVERLKTLYGDDHRFTLQWPEAGGCQVTIELPFKTTTQNQRSERASLLRRDRHHDLLMSHKNACETNQAFISLSIRVGKPEARNVSTNACRRADRLPSGSPIVVGCWGWRDCQLGWPYHSHPH